MNAHDIAVISAVSIALAGALAAQVPQESKPVPKDSQRVSIAGCAKGYVFTVGPRMPEVVGAVNITPGTHLRLNGPKKLITEIDTYKNSMIAITGLMKKGQFGPDGVSLGGGVRMTPAAPPTGGATGATPVAGPPTIDVEGWSPTTGSCS
jgi:hypothetical protein